MNYSQYLLYIYIVYIASICICMFVAFVGNTSFNEKPYFEQKKCFSAKYVGWTEVEKSSGKKPY